MKYFIVIYSTHFQHFKNRLEVYEEKNEILAS